MFSVGKMDSNNLSEEYVHFDLIKSYFDPLILHYSEKDIKNFHMFMLCKVKAKDCHLIEGNDRFLLSPGKEIDQIWHEMLLRPSLYAKYMRYLFRDEPKDQETLFVDHQPEAVNDNNTMKLKRLRKTEEVWKELFGEEVKFPGTKDIVNLENFDKNQLMPNPKRARVNEIKDESDHIVITVKTLIKNYSVYISKNNTVLKLKERISDISGIPLMIMRLICSSKELLHNNVKIKNLPCPIVHLLLRLSGC